MEGEVLPLGLEFRVQASWIMNMNQARQKPLVLPGAKTREEGTTELCANQIKINCERGQKANGKARDE